MSTDLDTHGTGQPPEIKRLERILFVEDSVDIRRVATLAMERVGHFDVLACASGEEAIREAGKYRPDLLLLDVMMPDMDGPTTLARLRELPALAFTPAVFMTAKAHPTEIAHLRSLGAIGVIIKPFEPMSLSARLAEIWADSANLDPGAEHLLDEIDRLQAAYADTFRGKWEQLRDACEMVKRGDGKAYRQARLIAHTLAGGGATMGYPEVSRVSGELAQLLEVIERSTGDPVSARELTRELDTLMLDLRDAATVPAGSKRRAARSRRVDSSNTAPKKLVYLVEDDIQLARSLRLQLRLFGFDAETFEQPSLLEAALKIRRPVAVIMDIMFPDDPLAGTRVIAKSVAIKTGAVPVIFMSGRTDMAARLAAVRACATDYLVKPVRVADLVDRLDRLMDTALEDPYRVAVVNSDSVTAERHAGILRGAGMTVDVLLDPMQIATLLDQSDVELIVIQDGMTECSGIELARVISQIDRAAMRPVLMLAERGAAVARMAEDGILFMPVADDDLLPSVGAWCRRHRAQRKLLTIDGLTGLANHTRILQQLEFEVARSRRQGFALAVAMIDVDHFKRLNDSQGHAVGDRVLASLGRFLRQRLRKSDFVGRYGGEEFMVLLSETSGERANERLDVLRGEFASIRHVGPADAFQVTFSTGIASFPGYAGATDLATAADRALYEAKRGGRNRVVMAPAGSAT